MLYRSADVVINVLDLNDNSPVFSSNPFTGEVAHDDLLGNIIVTVCMFSIVPKEFKQQFNGYACSEYRKG